MPNNEQIDKISSLLLMKERFVQYKNKVDDFLDRFLEIKREEFKNVNVWGEELIDKLKEFAKRGKTIRGGLVLASYEMFGRKIDESSLRVAAAIEILHSALLIHDDILDKDELRRGSKTIHAQYKDFAKTKGINDSTHFGYGMAICAGDICISMAFYLIESLNSDSKLKRDIIELFSKGLNKVGLAEMDDFYMGYTDEDVTEERIFEMYRGKTASYTFGVPLISGAILAEQDDKTIEKLRELSDKIGVIFQIKDDELGIFGDEIKLGKPVGSDIVENKKTIFRQRLFERALNEEKENLGKIFGNSNLTRNDVNYVRELIEKHGILEEISEMVLEYDKQAREILNSISINEEEKKFFEDFMDYNLNRVN